MWRSLMILAVLLVSAGRGMAQEPGSLRSGDQVRLQAQSMKGVYDVVHSTGTALTVRDRRTSEEIQLSLANVERLDVRLGRRSRGAGLVRGMALGLLIGAVPGAVLGYAAGDDPPGWFSFTAEEKAVLMGTLMGTAGTAVGGTIGAVKPGSRWHRVMPGNSTSVAVVPLRTRAVGVLLSRNF
jgi:hypothetical protein